MTEAPLGEFRAGVSTFLDPWHQDLLERVPLP